MHHTLKLVFGLALLALPFSAQADSVSCSDATHYNTDHIYKKGDTVWWHDGGNVYLKYRCEKDVCNTNAREATDKIGKDQPQHGDSWKSVGHCDKDPS